MTSSQSRQKCIRASSGFTLIEVTIASLVTLVGLLSVAQLFIVAAVVNRSSKQTTLASTLAKRKLEQLLALPLDHAALSYQGSLFSSGLPSGGTTENYYVDHDRSVETGGVSAIQKGTGQISSAPFYEGQEPSYVVQWVVLADSATIPMTGLRRIIVRAESTRPGLAGMGKGSNQTSVEYAQVSTIRTPAQ